jgi:hypothetical protein
MLAADLVFSKIRGASSLSLAEESVLIADHSQHLALLKTCEVCLSESSYPVLLSFYAHHRYVVYSDQFFDLVMQAERSMIDPRPN